MERRLNTTVIKRGFGAYDALIYGNTCFVSIKTFRDSNYFQFIIYYYYYHRRRRRRRHSRTGHEVRSWFNDSRRRFGFAAARVTALEFILQTEKIF